VSFDDLRVRAKLLAEKLSKQGKDQEIQTNDLELQNDMDNHMEYY